VLSPAAVGGVLQQMHDSYVQNLPPGEGAVPFYPAPTLLPRLPQQPQQPPRPARPRQLPKQQPGQRRRGPKLQVTPLTGDGDGSVACRPCVSGTQLYLGRYPPLEERLLTDA
jgi:hypothetical protein